MKSEYYNRRVKYCKYEFLTNKSIIDFIDTSLFAFVNPVREVYHHDLIYPKTFEDIVIEIR